MTRTVLTGPPTRRGLAWGVFVLLGAAVLLGARDGSDVAAKDEAAKTALPADLALVPTESFGFFTVHVADLWNAEGAKAWRTEFAKTYPEAFQEAVKGAGVPPEEIERLTVVMPKTPSPNDQGGPQVVILVATTKPFDQKKLLEGLLPDAKEEKHKGKTVFVLGDAAVYPVDKTTFVMGRIEMIEDLIDQAGKNANGTLAPALAAAAGKHHLAGGMRPTAVLESVGNLLPPQAEPFKPLLEATLAYGTIDFGKEAKLEGRLVCGGETDAKNAVTAAKGLLALAQIGLLEAEKEVEKRPKGKADNIKNVLKVVGTALKTVPIEAKGKEMTFGLTLKADLATLARASLELADVRRGAAGAMSSQNNLKQMALAMHNYASSNASTFPPAAITDKKGKPLLSWRVAILPYIEQDALYKEFKLDEPWDSEHNKKLLAKMPPTYMTPEQAAADENTRPTVTHYRVFFGKGAAFEGDSGQPLPAGFPDGTSNTILIVEAADPVSWTKPDELPFDPKKDLPKLGLKGQERFNAAFADGSVRALKKTIDKDTLKALITRNGGEPVTIPDD